MVKDLMHLASNPHMVQHCLSCRADREKGILQGKLRCAQKAINEGAHAHHHPASTETAAASKEGTTTAAAMEQHQLKTRIFELENEVHTCIEMSSFCLALFSGPAHLFGVWPHVLGKSWK